MWKPAELYSKLLKGWLYRGIYIYGTIIGLIKGDTRNLDYSSAEYQCFIITNCLQSELTDI